MGLDHTRRLVRLRKVSPESDRIYTRSRKSLAKGFRRAVEAKVACSLVSIADPYERGGATAALTGHNPHESLVRSDFRAVDACRGAECVDEPVSSRSRLSIAYLACVEDYHGDHFGGGAGKECLVGGVTVEQADLLLRERNPELAGALNH